MRHSRTNSVRPLEPKIENGFRDPESASEPEFMRPGKPGFLCNATTAQRREARQTMSTTDRARSAPNHPPSTPDEDRKVALSSFLGKTIEFYDFILISGLRILPQA